MKEGTMNEPEAVTEEDRVHDQWYRDAKDQTLESLPEFLRHLASDYKHSYGSICHAVTAAGLAAMRAFNKTGQGKINKFQASTIMWLFIHNWVYSDNKTGLSIINYDDLLRPEYRDKFEVTLSKRIWAAVREEAGKRIMDNTDAEGKTKVAPKVYAHWQSIVEGKVPFGLRVM